MEGIASRKKAAYNQSLIASASTRQYESATLPAKQFGCALPAVPFSEKQQRQSRYDGGLEEDGVTALPLVQVQAAEPPAHIARDLRKSNFEHQQPRNAYNEVPLTGCQLCIAPHYLLPHSFGQDFALGDEGEANDSDVSQLAGLPWGFNQVNGKLQHFLTDLGGNLAQAADFQLDALVFESALA